MKVKEALQNILVMAFVVVGLMTSVYFWYKLTRWSAVPTPMEQGCQLWSHQRCSNRCVVVPEPDQLSCLMECYKPWYERCLREVEEW